MRGRPSGRPFCILAPGFFVPYRFPYLHLPLPYRPSAILTPAIVREPPQENQMATRHLSQTELAARWNISHRTLERWRTVGEGPRFIRLIGRIVYRLEDVEAFEAEQTHGAEVGSSHAASA